MHAPPFNRGADFGVADGSVRGNKLDVKPAADAFETRANVIKAIQGHILAKAVYGGLFRRPQ